MCCLVEGKATTSIPVMFVTKASRVTVDKWRELFIKWSCIFPHCCILVLSCRSRTYYEQHWSILRFTIRWREKECGVRCCWRNRALGGPILTAGTPVLDTSHSRWCQVESSSGLPVPKTQEQEKPRFADQFSCRGATTILATKSLYAKFPFANQRNHVATERFW